MSTQSKPVVKCPKCRKAGAWFEHPWGPFCSERCKLVDLGKWFNEEHRISRDLAPGDFEAFENLEPGADPNGRPGEGSGR